MEEHDDERDDFEDLQVEREQRRTDQIPLRGVLGGDLQGMPDLLEKGRLLLLRHIALQGLALVLEALVEGALELGLDIVAVLAWQVTRHLCQIVVDESHVPFLANRESILSFS